MANYNTQQQDDINREEEDKIWDAFMAFDYEQLGYIQTNQLRNALERVGERIDEQETFKMIAEADPENTGTIQFAQFKELILEKRENEQGSSDEDLLDAFVAMGGRADGQGFIDAEMLIKTIKEEFEMTIDIRALIDDVDADGSGEIEFDEFKVLLQTAKGIETDDN